MSGASFILAINMVVAGMFALAFFLVAASNRSDRVALWFGGGYLCGVGFFVFEFLLPFQDHPKLTGYLAFCSFLGAMTAVAIGIHRRYRQPVNWLLLAGIVAASMALNWLAFDLPRDALARMYAYQSPYAVMSAIAVVAILRAPRGQWVDLALGGVMAVTALHFLAKPLIAASTDGAGASAAAYIGTTYALFSQSLSAVASVATGLLMLTVLVRDMLLDAIRRSETDPLSGLLNRRGFEERVEAGLAAVSRGVPAALITCDLDNFKSVNDSFGHDVGDQVIRAFAELLRRGAPPQAIVARMGGEEFAVFLPGANLPAAQLYAEAVRSAFSGMSVPGVGNDTRLAASFGVAEVGATEPLSDLRRRADAALYASKKAGRDRVTIAAMQDADAMPGHPFPGMAYPLRSVG